MLISIRINSALLNFESLEVRVNSAQIVASTQSNATPSYYNLYNKIAVSEPIRQANLCLIVYTEYISYILSILQAVQNFFKVLKQYFFTFAPPAAGLKLPMSVLSNYFFYMFVKCYEILQDHVFQCLSKKLIKLRKMKGFILPSLTLLSPQTPAVFWLIQLYIVI